MNEFFNRITAVAVILEAIKRSQSIRKKITEILNTEKIPITDGVVALLVLAVGHAKESGLNRGGFIFMCETLYEAIDLIKDGQEDIIIGSESQNN